MALLSIRRLLPALAMALLLLPAFGMSAGAFGIYPAGTTGIDVSWPQCTAPLPAATQSFAVVGINGGRAFYQNPCLIAEFAWAQTSPAPPSFFMNLNSPVGLAAFKARTGPKGACRFDDNVCLAYNFGYNAARLAFADAQSQETAATMWWLDIETDNSWSDNTAENAQVILGASDYLRSQGRTVGVYSTPKQWGQIAGNFNPGLPNWVAGADDAVAARDYCDPSHAFGGGQVWLVQYISGDFDIDLACPPPPLAGAAAPAGLQVTAINPTTVQLTWSAPSTPTDSYAITNGVAQIATVRAPSTSYTVTGLTPGSYGCYAIAALSAGVYSAWTPYACVTTPPH